MKVYRGILASVIIGLFGCPLFAQIPAIGNIETPYSNLQGTVHIAGNVYGSGAVPYGPVGTNLILTGTNLGTSGAVQFIGYSNSEPNGSVADATVTTWTSNMLFLTVPASAKSGLVKVIVNGKISNGLPFVVTPGVYAGSCPASPPSSQLQITTSSLHDGIVGQSYSATLSAIGGVAPYHWSIVGGALPSGLSLSSSTGTISGTPTAATGAIDLTIQVSDSGTTQQINEAVISLTIDPQTLNPGTVIYSYTVQQFDGTGNIQQYQDSVMGTWTFNYDSLNRISSGSASTGTYSGKYACWTYDSFGNRKSESLSNSSCANNPPLSSWATYNSSNTNRMDTDSLSVGNANLVYNSTGQQTTGVPGYDAAGELTSDGPNTYLYDPEGRICAVKSEPVSGTYAMTGYFYDAEGRRVAKGSISTMSCDPASNGFHVTETYVLGPSGEEASMVDQNGNWERSNIFGAGRFLGTYDATDLHFHIADPLGTRRMQTSSIGQPETDCQSLPYGNGLNCFNDQYAPARANDSTPLHFTGKERDSESGNDYFRARYYASTMGRFLSPDWSAKVVPVPYAKLDDPQSLNLYAYVRNNPLDSVDIDGHCDGNGILCKAVNWLTSSHSASGSKSATAMQETASSGGLSANGRLATAQASASASYGRDTSASAKASASLASVTINEGSHSTTQVDTHTVNAGAHAGISLGGKDGVGVSAGAGAHADVLSASQTETVKFGPVTVTGTASGDVGIGANASAALGTKGVSASAGFAFGYGGSLSLNLSWDGMQASGGASVKGTMDKTTVTVNKPEVQ